MIIKTSDFYKSATAPQGYPTDNLPEVAFAGKSNVGKSSLLNTILNRRKLARISRTPGRTQLINYFIINNSYYFVDLPGYGYSKVSKDTSKGWGAMMETYFKKSANLKCVVLILDVRRLITEEDYLLIKFFNSLAIPIIYALTKTDKLSNNELFKQKQELKKILGDFFSEERFVMFSSLKKTGVTEMLDKIGKYLVDDEQI